MRPDDYVAFLCGLHKLEDLELCGTGVGDDVLDAMQACPQLSKLGLCYGEITDAGLRELRSLPNLRTLCLSYTYVTDLGLKTLKELQNLKFLDVTGTSVSKDAIDELQRASPSLVIKSNFDPPFRPTPGNGTNMGGMF